MTYITGIINLFLFILPAYFANATPVALKTGNTKVPLDMKLKFWDRRRIFGKSKTIAGFILGVAVGTLVGVIIAIFFPLYASQETQILAAFLLSLGTMVGDAAGSFIKRRLAFEKGKPFYITDQLSFFLVAMAFIYPIKPVFLNWTGFIFLLILTIILHIATNITAYKMKIKKVPW